MSEKLSPSEAVFGFAAWLSTSQDSITIGCGHVCDILAEKVKVFCDENNLEFPRNGWEANLIHPSGECSFEKVEEEVPEVQYQRHVKKAMPLENPKGMSWFNGTSWGEK
jgi:hypothetical protein